MATNFPTALDSAGTTLPYPSSTSERNSPSLASISDNEHDAIIAAETKVGVGASSQTPAANTVLLGTGAGTSQWGALTTGYLGSTTGTGAVVLASGATLTSPTINSPTISTPTISGSLGSLTTSTLTASGLITANAGLTVVGALTLPTNSITAANLATNAITLGYAQITSSFTGVTSTTAVQVTGLTASVTIPSGSRKIKVSFSGALYTGTSGGGVNLSIWDGTVVLGMQIGGMVTTTSGVGNTYSGTCFTVVTPTAGAKTYNIGLSSASGSYSANIYCTPGYPATILVEAI